MRRGGGRALSLELQQETLAQKFCGEEKFHICDNKRKQYNKTKSIHLSASVYLAEADISASISPKFKTFKEFNDLVNPLTSTDL